MIREAELLSLIVCLIFRIQFSWNHQCITLHRESITCFLNRASCFQSMCYSTYVEMTRFIPHVMSSHMEHKCIFIWVLNWYLFCCSRIHISTSTEIGTLESLDEAISIWIEVRFGQLWHLPGILLVQMKWEASTRRCKIQTSPCVFSWYPTFWLKIYQIYQLWISSSIRMHEIKTSRSTDLRNCQGEKLDFF